MSSKNSHSNHSSNLSSVALVNMPVAATQTPSLGLSILKSALADLDIAADVHYLNIKYAEMVGLEVLEALETLPTAQLVGDWIFSEALWGKDPERDRGYIEDILRDASEDHLFHENRAASESLIQEVLRCKDCVDEFLDHCLNAIPWEQYRIVGFTSLFQQHIAALAMAKKLKQHYPHLVIVFGGANCVDDMGRAVIDNFEFVDVVCTGMGENIFPPFVSDYLSGKTPATNSGLLVRGSIPCLPQPAGPAKTMDDLAYPDFDDFFAQREKSSLEAEKLSMLVETSRGCWWGQKHHCTFCGLNAESMKFKFKSSQRAMAEFQYLVERYGHYTKTIAVVDNIIPMDYIKGFLVELRDSELNLELFYETKANLKKEHIQLYRQAGLSSIQPGVESFSNRLLKEMNKGITGLQNVQFLKWCLEFGLRPMWNYMVGFPGEVEQDHFEQMALMDSLSHFYPPDVSWVRIDRYSPFHNTPEKFGISNLRPFGSFKYLYPDLDEKQRERMAYFFLADFEAKQKMTEYAFDVRQAIQKWNDDFIGSALFHFELDEQLVVADYRPSAVKNVYRLTPKQKIIYEACDQIRGESYLFKLMDLTGTTEQMRNQLSEIVKPLVDGKIMLHEDSRYLSLSVSINNGFFPPESIWARLNELFTGELVEA